MRADEETDMTKLISDFRNINNAPKTSKSRNVLWFQILDLVTFIITKICMYVCNIYLLLYIFTIFLYFVIIPS